MLQNAMVALPYLIAHIATAIVIFAVGMQIYKWLTPYHETSLIRAGNTAAGVAYAGASIGMALPIAAALHSGLSVLDIALWAAVAVAFQLLAFLLVDRMLGGVRQPIEDGVIAAGLKLGGTHVAVGLITAAAIAT